ncbi:MAG: YdeI/OmpD-associated family protein [Roseicyclus sp.]|jgi:uncharacterized protein YdeI (YjbR/CyaY-like superfamily)|nr:YdeI/OmpD-associated family protein [Roseicyclus sp.]
MAGQGDIFVSSLARGILERMMITDIDDYFSRGCGRCDRFDQKDCSTRFWERGLAKLCEICLAADLKETVKWGHPCYMHAGRNIAIIGAFRGDFRLSFFEAGLMTDPDCVLEKQGPNTRHPDMIRFTSNSQVSDMEGTISAYLDEAKGYADKGITVPKDTSALVLPDELKDALEADAELADAFHALTRGRQRSYVVNLNGAKKSETRVARIAQFRDKIIAGKGAMER